MLDMKTVEAIAGPMMRDALAPYGVESVRFEAETDHYGDPIIRTYLRYRKDAPKFDALAFIETLIRIRERLSAEGDDRFIHATHNYQDGPFAEEDYKPAKRSRRSA